MTLTDLYRKALERLQVVAAGESADPDDTLLVSAKYTAVYGLLVGKRLVAWGVNDDVPDYAEIPLTNILAWACAADFGHNQNDFAADGSLDLPGGGSLAERSLRLQLTNTNYSYPAQSEYF